MEDFIKKEHNQKYAIVIYDNHTYCKNWLTKNIYFQDYTKLEWEWNNNLKLEIKSENVEILFESAVETIICFETETLRDEIYNWLSENNLKDPEYWEKLVPAIKAKLESDNLSDIKTGIKELKEWVESYNANDVDDLMYNADLSLFGYDYNDFPEGDLWPNPLFDQLLERFGADLNEADLFNLIAALFNQNEEYMDCKATYTAIMLLLENRTAELELKIIDATLIALDGYESGHRYFENSLLDRLVDDIFPTFSVKSILKLLQNSDSGNLHREGDDFISLAELALNKDPDQEEQQALEVLINKQK